LYATNTARHLIDLVAFAIGRYAGADGFDDAGKIDTRNCKQIADAATIKGDAKQTTANPGEL
jgi:hypothetical protein